ncbi:dihydroxyacetone kinase, N-terminal domain [Pelolinea submarina]|uniref:Dihydroxyacetone kinase DhaK subunit n=2 Tax=Pelolinea submarina TaxID=913107 RepID=A0A347ZR47_9CHLR|nr:dihydroxyacetone kinase subunit DhaK [Pelolinea submarina]REG11668.1 dihydroxyacetone kinase DhaK subunit [Pelolinea submarina]BBB47778.1 dihydroxyacetone kinase, N-terminal domain [Pelolinea submarina]
MVKKIINNPKDVVKETMEGLLLANHGKIVKVEDANAVVRPSIPAGKVGLLVGGGSGHEPLFAGFVGDHLADGAVSGNVFAAPAPDQILAATKALDHGKGVLYLYGNYAGDNMNFDIAAELAELEGISTKTVRIYDDVASAPLERIDDRRGIAGDLFVIKVAGAAAAELDSLDEVFRVTAKARDFTRSMGVAISPGSIPETGQPTFEIGEGEIEIGMGLHGEAGVSREKLMPADELVSRMTDLILKDLPFKAGDEVCLLINNLGATTMMELLIVNRKVREILAEAKINVHDTMMGSYCTSQEMAGFSISLLKLDDELKKYYDMPAESFAFTKR